MKKVDEFIFKQIDDFQNSSQYQGLVDFLRQIPIEHLPLVKWASTVIFFLFPLLLIFLSYSSNQQIRSEIASKYEVMTTAQQMLSESGKISNLRDSLIAGEMVESSEDLAQKIYQASQVADLSSSVTVTQLEEVSNEAGLIKSSSDIEFKGIALSVLMSFLETLSKDLKMKVYSIQIEKNQNVNNLSGSLKAYYLAIDNEEY